MSPSKFERREKVSMMLSQGCPQIQIARQLGVNRRTIVRDKVFLIGEAQRWMNDLARDGFNFETKMALDLLKDTQKQLNEMLLDPSLSREEKRKLLKQRDDNIAQQLQIIVNGPLIASIKRYLPSELKSFENFR